MKKILGNKLGMTSLFDVTGKRVAVTIIQVLPNRVLTQKTVAKHGYDAVQVAYGKKVRPSSATKPYIGQFKHTKFAITDRIVELRGLTGFNPGDEINLVNTFNPGDLVDVQGISKGHGTTGAVELWNFKIGPKSHGAGYPHRFQGSLETGRGGSQAQRVWKGKKMAARWGNETVTVANLEVIALDHENNLLLLKGAVPGRKRGLVKIKTTVKSIKTVKQSFLAFDAKAKGEQRVVD